MKKSLYFKNYSTDLDEIFRASSDHQCGIVGVPAHAYNEYKMAEGRHIENFKFALTPQWFNR